MVQRERASDDVKGGIRQVQALRGRPEMVHVILTGRNAHPLLVEISNTVTEMRELKHAYQKGNSGPARHRILGAARENGSQLI